jgi:hypothetical protein
MSAWKNSQKDYPICPEGPQQLVCVDVIDLGIKHNEQYQKDEHKVRIVYQTAEADDRNVPYRVSGQFTVSLHEKAKLRKTLESWFGRKLSKDEVEGQGIDPETLIGLNGFANIVHNPGNNGKTYANVDSLMPLPKNLPKISARDYVRVKDRPAKPGQQSDSDVPF